REPSGNVSAARCPGAVAYSRGGAGGERCDQRAAPATRSATAAAIRAGHTVAVHQRCEMGRSGGCAGSYSDGSAPATAPENGDGVARADRRGGRAPGRRRRPLVAPFAARTATRVRDRARAAGGAHVA